MLERYQRQVAALSQTQEAGAGVYRIGDRDELTGYYEVVHPDGGVTRDGVKLFESSYEVGDEVAATRRSDGIWLLNSLPPTIATAPPLPRTTPDVPSRDLDYLDGRVFNNEEPEEPGDLPNIAILYRVRGWYRRFTQQINSPTPYYVKTPNFKPQIYVYEPGSEALTSYFANQTKLVERVELFDLMDLQPLYRWDSVAGGLLIKMPNFLDPVEFPDYNYISYSDLPLYYAMKEAGLFGEDLKSKFNYFYLYFVDVKALSNNRKIQIRLAEALEDIGEGGSEFESEWVENNIFKSPQTELFAEAKIIPFEDDFEDAVNELKNLSTPGNPAAMRQKLIQFFIDWWKKDGETSAVHYRGDVEVSLADTSLDDVYGKIYPSDPALVPAIPGLGVARLLVETQKRLFAPFVNGYSGLYGAGAGTGTNAFGYGYDAPEFPEEFAIYHWESSLKRRPYNLFGTTFLDIEIKPSTQSQRLNSMRIGRSISTGNGSYLYPTNCGFKYRQVPHPVVSGTFVLVQEAVLKANYRNISTRLTGINPQTGATTSYDSGNNSFEDSVISWVRNPFTNRYFPGSSELSRPSASFWNTPFSAENYSP